MDDLNTPPKKQIDFRIIIPNIITLVALCAGISSMKFALADKMDMAAGMILIAALLDGIDGQVARALRGTSNFGAQLDSLADLVNFGVAPAVTLYIWSLQYYGNLGWFVTLVFVMSMALRLARFNVSNNLMPIEEENKTPLKKEKITHFVGIPAPASALLSFFPLYVELADIGTVPAFVVIIYLLFLAAMTISPVKTFSPKMLKFSSKYAGIILIGLSVFSISLVTFTWKTLLIVGAIYVCHLIYAVFKFFRRSHRIA